MNLEQKDILITIFNYNVNDNAKKLLENFSKHFVTIVIDSGSENPDESFIKCPNIYYSGLFNFAKKIAEASPVKWLLIINSDIKISDENFEKLIIRLKTITNIPDLGVYSPSVMNYDIQMSNTDNGLVDVWILEGFFNLINMEVLKLIEPINLSVNRLGWGVDIVTGYYANKLNLRCVIDTNITIEHDQIDSGYDRTVAREQMFEYFKSLNDPGLVSFYESDVLGKRVKQNN